MDIVAALFVFAFLGAIGVVTGALAKRKGYSFLPWFLAGGVIGLIVLSFQPFANDPKISEMEQRYIAESGNRTGWKVAVVSIGLVLLRMLLAN